MGERARRAETALEDVVFVTLTNAETTGRAWSADTHMAETMLLARKHERDGPAKTLARYVNMRPRPKTETEALLFADALYGLGEEETQGDVTVTTGADLYGSPGESLEQPFEPRHALAEAGDIGQDVADVGPHVARVGRCLVR